MMRLVAADIDIGSQALGYGYGRFGCAPCVGRREEQFALRDEHDLLLKIGIHRKHSETEKIAHNFHTGDSVENVFWNVSTFGQQHFVQHDFLSRFFRSSSAPTGGFEHVVRKPANGIVPKPTAHPSAWFPDGKRG